MGIDFGCLVLAAVIALMAIAIRLPKQLKQFSIVILIFYSLTYYEVIWTSNKDVPDLDLSVLYLLLLLTIFLMWNVSSILIVDEERLQHDGRDQHRVDLARRQQAFAARFRR